MTKHQRYYIKHKAKILRIKKEKYKHKTKNVKTQIPRDKDYHKNYYIQNKTKLLNYQKQLRLLKKPIQPKPIPIQEEPMYKLLFNK